MAASVGVYFFFFVMCCAALRPQMTADVEGELHGNATDDHAADATMYNKCCCYFPGTDNADKLWLINHNNLNTEHCPKVGCLKKSMGGFQIDSRAKCADKPSKGDLFCGTTTWYDCTARSHPNIAEPRGWDKCYQKGRDEAPSARNLEACQLLRH
mmetsp:Transcript_43181/g.99547  ORF Transcript_43181/g.99547 Transcript_43181/m.99547 type:complete len:155 (+) Transcript_43181:76-540(+)